MPSLPLENLPELYHRSRDIRFLCQFQFPEDAGTEAIQLLSESCPDVSAEWKDGILHLGQDYGGDFAKVAEILAAVMERRGVDAIVTMEGSCVGPENSSSKFGGIACAVGAGDFRFSGTDLLAKNLRMQVRLARIASKFEKHNPGWMAAKLKEAEDRIKMMEREEAGACGQDIA